MWNRLRKPGRRRRIGEILDAEHDYRLYRCHKDTGPIGEAFTNVYHTCIPLQQVRLPRLFAYMTGTRVPDKGRYGVHTNYVVWNRSIICCQQIVTALKNDNRREFTLMIVLWWHTRRYLCLPQFPKSCPGIRDGGKTEAISRRSSDASPAWLYRWSHYFMDRQFIIDIA